MQATGWPGISTMVFDARMFGPDTGMPAVNNYTLTIAVP
jgi:hypothetical protein